MPLRSSLAARFCVMVLIVLAALGGRWPSSFAQEPESASGGRCLALLVGIQEFQDARICPLRFCAADADALYRLLVDPNYGRFAPGDAVLLLDAQATRERVQAELRNLARRARPEDTVLIYFSSHGFQNPPDPDKSADPDAEGLSYWVLNDTRIDAEAYANRTVRVVPETAAASKEIKTLFDSIRARRFVVLLDCCYSVATVAPLTRGDWRAGHPVDPFAKLRGKGRVVIAATDGRECALEVPSLRHGVFTYFVLEGLKGRADANRDQAVEVIELWEYLKNKIGEYARRAGEIQTPPDPSCHRADFPHFSIAF